MEFEKQKSPFNKEQLMPQDETLEILSNKIKYSISVLKETDINEKRVTLSPLGVEMLINEGVTVYVEKGAGLGASFSDVEYSEVGAEIVHKTDCFKSDILIKISSFTKIEINLLKKGQLLFSALNVNSLKKEYINSLMHKKITAISYELIQDDTGCFPIVRAMSDIAGSTSILVAAEILSTNNGGKGEMLGGVAGVKPTEVLIIGAGAASESAARTALGLGATVKIFDDSVRRLRRIQANLGQKIFTSVMFKRLIDSAIISSDVVIGAYRNKNNEQFLISEDTVKKMKANSVIIDISVDSGGVFETSQITTHQNPTYQRHNVIHYCVPNIASRVSRTASYSISNILSQVLIDIAMVGDVNAVIKNTEGIRNGVYIFNGILTNEKVGVMLDIPHKDIELLMYAF